MSSRKAPPAESPATGPLTLAELHDKDFTSFKGIGEKREADLRALEVENVLDLLMYYPRRWVDRSQ